MFRRRSSAKGRHSASKSKSPPLFRKRRNASSLSPATAEGSVPSPLPTPLQVNDQVLAANSDRKPVDTPEPLKAVDNSAVLQSTPRSPIRLARMDFLSSYFSGTPRNDTSSATTPGVRRSDAPDVPFRTERGERRSALETLESDDVEKNDAGEESPKGFSPRGGIHAAFRRARRENSKPCDGISTPGQAEGRKKGGVHFLAPMDGDDDGLHTITITPKPRSKAADKEDKKSMGSTPWGHDTGTEDQEGRRFVIRRNSCESAASHAAKRDKNKDRGVFQFFGIKLSRPSASP